MPASGPVEELMLRWEAARQLGQQLTVEELCAGCPHLADEVRRRIRVILAMEEVLGVGDDDPRRTMLVPTEGVEAGLKGETLPVIPGYAIIRVIDRGGMGVVYEARQVELGRTVAVKMISGGRLGPRVVARFRLEAEAAARLQHPNFVQIFEVGQVNGQPFFSMEYVTGGSLAQLLARQPPSARRAAELTATLARAVHAAHECGFVHRDLKPSNVMLTADGTPKIADFGLAKRLDHDAAHTHTGEILGTPSYMAPEQAEGHKDQIGPATDVYALGAILYELLAGKPPFQGASPLAALRLVVAQEPIAPSRLARSVPRDLEAICLKCLEKAPSQRYSSAQALAEDLQRFLCGEPVTARPGGWAWRTWKWARRHPQRAAWCVAAGVLALSAAFVLLREDDSLREARLHAGKQAPLVREILQRHCFECHGGNPRRVAKKLRILDHPNLLDSARRIVVPGAPEDSRLIQRIADGSMPPEAEEIRLPRVSEKELVILKEWILGGAPPFGSGDTKPAVPSPAPHSELAARAKALFHNRCYKCHKYDVAEGGIKILHHRLLVTVRKVVVPGRPDDSELFQLLTTYDDAARMPPAPAPRLSPEEIATVRAWILEGALPFPRSE
ncbi:MAG: protein kinase [Gemmataceae bacterium]|nr:protein kinase [Gemmataceae bacterium]